MTDTSPPIKDDSAVHTALKVNLGLLDSLMTLAGELVLSRNQLLQSVKAEDLKTIALASQRIDLITSELQEAIMKTRMQPVDALLSGFSPRIADWAETCGKSVNLTVQGNEVELDKTILEALQEPLGELLRHLVDQGMDRTKDRERQGKSPVGTIALTAEHEAGQVIVTLSDDGPGIDPDESFDWALAEGLVALDQTRDTTGQQKLELAFLRPCADSSSVAARIESLGGIIDIASSPRTGTRIRIKLPLTLAIIPSQIASVGSDRYALPQVNLDELVRIPAAQVKDKIEKVGEAAVVRLRGALLPLLDLAGLLGIERQYRDDAKGEPRPERRKNIADRRSKQLRPQSGQTREEDTIPPVKRSTLDRRISSQSAIQIAVVSAGAYQYGLVVDGFLDAEEIVVKPMGRHMKECTAYAGATIMGDGKVALILDILNLAHTADLATATETRRLAQELNIASGPADENEAMILFRNGDHEYLCTPQHHVNRIERIRSRDIEDVGGQKVVQYRGGSLPLFSLDQVTDASPLPVKEDQEVLVLKTGLKEIGLMISPPVDTVDTAAALDESTLKGPAVKGSMVINGRTTRVLDVDEMVRILKPEWVHKN